MIFLFARKDPLSSTDKVKRVQCEEDWQAVLRLIDVDAAKRVILHLVEKGVCPVFFRIFMKIYVRVVSAKKSRTFKSSC